MKKLIKDYLVLIISIVIIAAILIYDMSSNWHSSLNFIKENKWFAIIPFCLTAVLNIYFPSLDKQRRTISQRSKEIFQLTKKKKKYLIATLCTFSILIAAIYLGYFLKFSKDMTDITNAQIEDSQGEKGKDTVEIIKSPIFSEKEVPPLNPDIVILTKNLSDLPKDIVRNSFLGKIIKKETMY